MKNMNKEKIKELEAQIKALKEEKLRTDREILESIEKLLKELISKTKISIPKSIQDILDDKIGYNPYQTPIPLPPQPYFFEVPHDGKYWRPAFDIEYKYNTEIY